MRYFLISITVVFVISGMLILNRFGAELFPTGEMMACVYGQKGYSMEGCDEAINGNRLWSRSKALAYNHRGNLFLKRFEPERALADYDSSLRLMPDLVIAHINRCNVLLRQKKLKSAETACRKGLSLEPQSSTAQVFMGSVYGARGDYHTALKYYATALRYEAGNFTAYLERCKTYLKLAEYDKGEADCTVAIRLKPGEFGPYFVRGAMRLDLGRLDESLKDAEKAVVLFPQNSESHALLGAVYLALKKYRKAEESIGAAFRLNARLPMAHFVRGRLREIAGDSGKALEDYQKAYALNPSLMLAQKRIADLMVRKGNFDKALAVLDEIVKKQPKSSEAHLGRCTVFLVKKSLDKALEACDRAVELAPWNAAVRGMRIGVFLASGKTDEAIASCKSGAGAFPLHFLYYTNCGLAYLKKGNQKEALGYLNGAIEVNPAALAALEARARIYAKRGRWDLSARDRKQLVERSPRPVASFYNNYAWALYKDGRSAEARPFAEKAVKLDPDADYAWGTYGEILEALGDRQKAIDCYKMSMSLDPKRKMSRDHLVRLGILK